MFNRLFWYLEKTTPEEPRKDNIVLLLNVSVWLSELSPEAQTLLIVCLFILALTALLVIAFYPSGAERIFHLTRQFRGLLRKEPRQILSHAKKRHAVRTRVERHQGGKP